MYQHVAPDDGTYTYAQVDFAGCSTVSDDNDDSNVWNPNGYCYGSPLPYLNAFPLGSFYHNPYTMQGDQICGDSQPTGPYSDEMMFCNDAKYDGYCMTVTFYDCFSRDDCPDPQSAIPTEDKQDNGPYFYVSTPVKEFCPGGQYSDGRMDNLDTMTYVDEWNNEAGTAVDNLGWPARATGYIAKLEQC